MRQDALQFPDLSARIEFSILTNEEGYDLNIVDLIVTGIIPEPEIELAIDTLSATLLKVS